MNDGKFTIGDDGEILEPDLKGKRKSKFGLYVSPLTIMVILFSMILLLGIGALGGVMVSRSFMVAVPTPTQTFLPPSPTPTQTASPTTIPSATLTTTPRPTVTQTAFPTTIPSATLTTTPRPTPTQTVSPTSTVTPDCQPADMFQELAALTPSGDNSADVAALIAEADKIRALNLTCNGITMKGGVVIKLQGPYIIPEGEYKVTATTTGFFILNYEVMSGSCGPESGLPDLFILSPGEGDTGAETLFSSQGCTIYFIPDNVSTSWKVVVEPVH